MGGIPGFSIQVAEFYEVKMSHSMSTCHRDRCHSERLVRVEWSLWRFLGGISVKAGGGPLLFIYPGTKRQDKLSSLPVVEGLPRPRLNWG
jgi:hypothetical protein